MPRKGQRKPRAFAGRRGDPHGLSNLFDGYLAWRAVKGHTPATVERDRKDLQVFERWCAERSLGDPREITRPVLERYQRTLFYYRKDNGQPLSISSQRARLTAVQSFFRWLVRSHHILYNPAADLDLPRLPRRLPKHILTLEEVEKVLAVPDVHDPLGLRDRAMLEFLYSTGVRRLELVGLKVLDIDWSRSVVFVQQGKGRRDRVVPVGDWALKWLDKYLHEVRPKWVTEPDEGYLFLNHLGGPLDPGYLTHRVRRTIEKADIGKRGGCHLLRHTMATLLHEAGADIRTIQAMLGHANLRNTEIYTQVSIPHLKAAHTLLHPAGKKPDLSAEMSEETEISEG